ncbi:MAG: 16S rRNA (guanine(966)-N(2))-methyltransferase RsmD [Desulfobacterales bacterium]|nr:16S rRNA (guanine(966)-N(2))-methyltransferase RsmD [Desulfobacterales bacterium]MBF0398338.1 16S rRNA (guanine(966)-N(2))-methyltransferase RsmD [Desulfobacterales bacterium]
MRIIGGDLKRRTLSSVKGIQTRPTSDKLREAIFNIISSDVCGTIVVDLFAGTGALGLEALSRGSDFALFIDNNKTSLGVIEKNIQALGLTAKTKIQCWDILKNLSCLKLIEAKFDIVFMDPPYNKNIIQPALVNLYNSNHIKKESLIIIEHSVLEPIPTNFNGFELTDQRKYGKTLVSFLKMET